MKKKITALLLALSLALTLAACGGKDAPAQGGAPDSTEVHTPAGGESDSSAPSDPGADGPSEPNVPGENADQKEADLTEFYNALLEEYEWPQLMALEGELLDGFYPGLSELSLKQCLVNTAAISAAVGEIALVEVENAEDAEKVEEIFQARIDYQVGDENNPGGAWYPMTIEGWQNNSHIVTQGNYVLLAVGDEAANAVSSFNALFQ